MQDYQHMLQQRPGLALPEPKALGTCLVTGAAGLVGKNLVKTLLAHGCKVVALINRTPLSIDANGSVQRLFTYQGDITQAASLDKVFAAHRIDTVFHTAAIISLLGGRHISPAYRDAAWKVNVDGTLKLLNCCQHNGVRRFIYTSSVDVCFHARPQPAMEENLPYCRQPKSVYVATKIAAEKAVLEANGRHGMLTCAIRPDGIYGPEPNELIDRMLEQLLSGNLRVRMGNPNVVQDNSHIENLVHGELLAALHLVDGGSSCGQAYFINDGEPMNSFEFYRPIIEGLGYKVPEFELPLKAMTRLLTAWESLHFKISLPRPVLAPHEIDKISITHFGSTAKARHQIGYEPVISVNEAMPAIIGYCLERQSRYYSAS